MKRTLARISIFIVSIYFVCQTVSAARLLIPGGQVVGMHLQDGSVTVTGLTEAGKQTGLAAGDRLLSVDGQAVRSPQDVLEALSRSDGRVKISLLRAGKTKTITVTPTVTSHGPRLGVQLRQGTTGLGTVTYYDPDTGSFGALGHSVNDPAGAPVTLESGAIYPARVSGINRGKPGAPGQLLGALTDSAPLGDLAKNTAQGVFGKISLSPAQPLPAATSEEIHTGRATIRSTVTGDGPQEYSVEILKIYPATQNKTRNMLIRITDPALLEATGGIVQGMSGSPIIQDGKLIGAVTHVLINDPTTGYGIFIENMLDAAA